MRIDNTIEVKENQNVISAENQSVALSDKISQNREDKKENQFQDNDSFQISDEAKRMFLEQLEQSKKENPYEDLIKLIEIANRISKGDKVPLSDEKKLLEKEPDMYLSAKMAAEMNRDKKHKNHKALFEDEEEGNIKEQINELKTENDFAEYESVESSSDGEISAESQEG